MEEAVMESTAQYWKPVWYEFELQMKLQLAQARKANVLPPPYSPSSARTVPSSISRCRRKPSFWQMASMS